MTKTLWKKVWNDLLANKTRTILVVLSVAVGVFAIGAIAGSHLVFSRDLKDGFMAVNPANVSVYSEAFDEELVTAIRKIPGVEQADGRRTEPVRLKMPDGEWKQLSLTVITDYDDIRVNKLRLVSGSWPPPEQGVLIERSSLAILPVKQGEKLDIEAPDGKRRSLKVAGIVHDVNAIPSFFSGTLNGYITFDTLEDLGSERELDSLHVLTKNQFTEKQDLAALAKKIWDKVEQGGRKVYYTNVLPRGEHPLESAFKAILYLTSVMGILALLLSAFLLVNTVTAILAQQTKQIGIIKAIGGTTGHIFKMYIASVLCYSLLSLIIAIPLGALGAWGLTFYQADLANVAVKGFYIAPEVVALQTLVAVVIPIAAALWPLRSGTRVPVRQALASYGIASEPPASFGRWLDEKITMLIERLRGLPRPLRLSIRNTFRRKGRLVLTLATLITAGAVFIAVLSVSQSLQVTIDDLFEYFRYDLNMVFNKVQRVEKIEQEALSISGIEAVESWGYSVGRILRNPRDENDSEQVFIYAPRADTRMISPQLVSGRWLLPEDENGVVVNSEVVKKIPGIKPGTQLTVKLAGKKVELVVVGVAKSLMAGASMYMNYPYFSYLSRESGRAASMQIQTTSHDKAFQAAVGRELEQHMKKVGMKVSFLQVTGELKEMIISQFNVIVVFLLVMAVLLAVVGALGLAGTMSINVVERTREIGVMRALGASSQAILCIFMTEGFVIGIISWFIGVALALPISKLLSDQVGLLFIEAPLTYRFSVSGAFIWLAILIVLSVVATWWPAYKATRISVRESLSYE